jgi:hypothetical protein
MVGFNPDRVFAQGVSAVRKDMPRTEIFGPIGHCWWALLLAYLGGWVARFVYLRRVAEAEK